MREILIASNQYSEDGQTVGGIEGLSQTEDSNYFSSYAHYSIHEEMLKVFYME